VRSLIPVLQVGEFRSDEGHVMLNAVGRNQGVAPVWSRRIKGGARPELPRCRVQIRPSKRSSVFDPKRAAYPPWDGLVSRHRERRRIRAPITVMTEMNLWCSFARFPLCDICGRVVLL